DELRLPVEGLEAVVCDLGDLDRCSDIVADVFEVKRPIRGRRPEFDESEYPSMVKGLSERLGTGPAYWPAPLRDPACSDPRRGGPPSARSWGWCWPLWRREATGRRRSWR
ncbi:unnamed protein product, partial [Prorocentrum cordatum]